MNNDLINSYKLHFGFKNRDRELPVVDGVVERISESNPILQAIYSLDPITNLPTGDIACYMSSNASPEVKKFVLDNIMLDTSSSALPSIPDGIDDETAFALSRQQGERLDSYLQRLNDFSKMQVEFRDLMIEDAKKASGNSKVAGQPAI